MAAPSSQAVLDAGADRFTAELPLVDQVVPPAMVPQPPRRRRPVVTQLNVLLDANHEPTLRVLERLLRQIGHHSGVSSVASASAAAAHDGFDLIISDLGLPVGSGQDVMRQLRDPILRPRHRPHRLWNEFGHHHQPGGDSPNMSPSRWTCRPWRLPSPCVGSRNNGDTAHRRC
jgi:hypothetical protein